MLRKAGKIAGLVLAAGLFSAPVIADITVGNHKSNRLGKGESLAPNWSTTHSNPVLNNYQETIRFIEVCVNGRSFVAAQSMAGVWDPKAGAGAGAGIGIVQVFEQAPDGNMQAVSCKN